MQMLFALLALHLAIQTACAQPSRLTPDIVIFASGQTAAVGDSSYKGGRLADSTAVVSGGGKAAVFTSKPGGGCQFYFKAAPLDGTLYSGISFKLAAAKDFTPDAAVGIQVDGAILDVPLKKYLAGGRATKSWQSVYVPLADLKAGTALNRLLSVFWAGGSTAGQPYIYLESIVLAALPPSCAPKPLPRPPPSPRPSPSPSPSKQSPPAKPPVTHPQSLYTSGNAIFWSNGTRFTGRGLNIHDTRSCGACLGSQDVDEVKRRIDFGVTQMGATFLRFVTEARVAGDDGAQYCYPNCAINDAYINDLYVLLNYIGTKYKHVQVMLAAWNSPRAWGMTDLGWPTAATNALWTKIVGAVGKLPWVWFGVVNEPQSNFDGSQDAQVWEAMNSAVAAIRAAEASLGVAPHIVTVQGTRAWGRNLAYYVTRPITAGDGRQVAYESHPYNKPSDFQELFIGPSKTLPVVLGEFGPATDVSEMTLEHAETLMKQVAPLGLPWAAWTLHMRCPPNLLEDLSNYGCGIDMPLKLTEWGRLVQKYLLQK